MRALLLGLFAPLLLGAAQPRLVTDVSETTIEIAYSFTGAELLLFGAILYPPRHKPRPGTEVVVVVKGPPETVVLREKAKVGGIWINHATARFRDAPTFYSVASSRPVDAFVPFPVAWRHGLGVANLPLHQEGSSDLAERQRFREGFLNLKLDSQLYSEHPDAVSIREDVLYRALIPLPPRVPTGRFTAETFLVRNGQVIAAATRHIVIDKTGLERLVAGAAVRRPFLYGALAVTLSLLLGLAAALLFGRRR
ncbi:TIGR02186 family protein [uncultured Sphingomonas sp.]|uniref:TIGR02186 family protein n=1 Tax=uncultured Sphingomonas sp. TaxID=158754 RepID=UPI0026000BA1|nr:TIGR02186 family protein [uncultured Sphingomonas sp.]